MLNVRMEKREIEMKTACKFMLIVLLIGILTSTFSIQPVKASGTIYIKADGSIDPPDAPISTFDNVTYTLNGNITSDGDGIVVERSNIIIDGNGYTLQGPGFYPYGLKGMNLSSINNVAIQNMNIKNFHFGIYINSSSGISITGNNVTGNNGTGISLGMSPHNSIIGNNIVGNDGFGISLSSSYSGLGSVNNTIHGNNIIANSFSGVGIYDSHNNTVSENNIINNGQRGVYLYAGNNHIFHNNFINNSQQAYSRYTNVWDDGYPSGGNYWSDYNGTDFYNGPNQDQLGGDGIGDTSYVIDENHQDNFPLMGMFSDFNATSEHHVQTICNSTISDFQFNGTVISFNASGENGTTGFCRICVPTALMNDTYKVFVNSTEIPHTLLPCSNSTHSYLYFTYNHSTQEVVIIPEFPSVMILPLLMTIAMLTVVFTKKKIH